MLCVMLMALMPLLRQVGTLLTGRWMRNRRPHPVYWSLKTIHLPSLVGAWPLERISHLLRRRRMMETKRMIISILFRFSASRLMRMLWLPIGCSVLVGLWGPTRVGAQDAPAERAPIFELHFDEDSLRVVRNEMRRPQRAAAGLDSGRAEAASLTPSAPRFPFQVVANNQAKKIVRFNADGTIKAQRSIPEGRKALVSANGAYVLLEAEKHSYYTQQVELQDAQGTRLWEAELHGDVRLSPTGEMVVSLREESTEIAPFSIWGPQGKLAEYETEAARVSFSADGQFLFAREIARGTDCVSLFDKQGQRLWQRHCNRGKVQWINRVFVSKSGRFMAFSYYTPPTSTRHLAVLDQNGDILWTRRGGLTYEVSFSEEDERMVVLNNKADGPIVGKRIEDLEAVVLNVRTGEVQRSFSLPPFYGSIYSNPRTYRGCTVFKLQNQDLMLGFFKRTSDGDLLAQMQLFDPTGVLSWERTINTGTEKWDRAEPAWLEKGPLHGISLGRVFQLFDVSRHNLSEE